MSRKIIGVTVGTPLSPNKIKEKLNPELTSAVNDALKQAKESGEFNGKDGVDGKDGYTPQKNVDYFDGKDGKDGADGKDGYTPQKNVDYFDGRDGQDGKDGADGKTPVAGVDYYTEEDKTLLRNEIINSLDWKGGSF